MRRVAPIQFKRTKAKKNRTVVRRIRTGPRLNDLIRISSLPDPTLASGLVALRHYCRPKMEGCQAHHRQPQRRPRGMQPRRQRSRFTAAPRNPAA